MRLTKTPVTYQACISVHAPISVISLPSRVSLPTKELACGMGGSVSVTKETITRARPLYPTSCGGRMAKGGREREELTPYLITSHITSHHSISYVGRARQALCSTYYTLYTVSVPTDLEFHPVGVGPQTLPKMKLILAQTLLFLHFVQEEACPPSYSFASYSFVLSLGHTINLINAPSPTQTNETLLSHLPSLFSLCHTTCLLFPLIYLDTSRGHSRLQTKWL